jgi:hypothetical protein
MIVQEVDHSDDEPSNNNHVGKDDEVIHSVNHDVVGILHMAMNNHFNDVDRLNMNYVLDELDYI